MNYFFEAARRIVEAEKLLWPGCESARCGGGSGGSSSSEFARQGTGLHERYKTIPADLSALITQNVQNAQTDTTLAAKQATLFSDLMQRTDASLPGYSALLGVTQQSPTDYSGRSTLQTIAARDPYSGSFENDTKEAYRQRASDAMAMAATGPQAVRGGDSRTGVLQSLLSERLAAGRGQEVRQAQMQDVQNVSDAAKSMAGIETARTGQVVGAATGLGGLVGQKNQQALDAGRALDANKLNNLGLLQLAAALQGTTIDKQTDDFTGRGSQGSSEMHGGINCCFIFLQALNGKLPWFIELGRFDYYTRERRRGYKWMSTWLVPAMKRSRIVSRVVNAVVIKPFLLWGAYRYGDDSAKPWQAWLRPYCKTWLALWGTLGRIVKEV